MLTLVIADDKTYRSDCIALTVKTYSPNEVIVLDDTVMSVADIEQYVYPSLFTVGTPMVHLRFMFDAKEKELTPQLLKKIIASPTLFLIEEMVLSKPFVTGLKKQGATVYNEPSSTKAAAIEKNLFAVTNVVTIASKKDRWLAYQKALAQFPIEAILGMVYWKVRDMALKEKTERGPYHLLYTQLIEAHAQAWQEGTPLALAIEKVLLQ